VQMREVENGIEEFQCVTRTQVSGTFFQLTPEEAAALRCQSGISKTRANAGGTRIGRGGRRYLPYAFTEHGALMAANVLSSPRVARDARSCSNL